MNTAELLKTHREKHHLTQEQLADKLYVSRQAISKWERGESMPDIENIVRLSDLYDISIDELLRGARFLPKPYILGDRNGKIRALTATITCSFFALIMSGGNGPVFIAVFCGLMLLALLLLREGKLIVGRDKIQVYWYERFRDRLKSMFRLGTYRHSYTYDEIDVVCLVYVVRKRFSPFDFNPDPFYLEFQTHDGNNYKFDIGSRLIKDIPILCDYLSKKGISVADKYGLIPHIVRGENIYDVMHPEDTKKRYIE
ncbi:helix-turn-helix transcriptional regulator [Erysipelothrix sp. HDW6C]|uniref:helix-turn-helix domain-containing protein n=1 Tax=Erysipelothrix sp. HDW6C TaxID=2714930 RepID=UPI00140C2964|nr:helix-turn-helix transcriptional regulator [Erysipelothrix sp. HDW6C]QIK70414.1 helix-turn-helix transcriptional regulator [Erysipelothrix sp. HDW6C]